MSINPRMKVRSRIIYRNISKWKLGLPLFFKLLAYFLLFATFPAMYFFGDHVLYLAFFALIIQIISVFVYSFYWYEMLRNMRNNSRDKKFVKKMKENYSW